MNNDLSCVFNALSNPVRLKVFQQIIKGACECDLTLKKGISQNCVSAISQKLKLPQPTVSNHIKELIREDLVYAKKVGKRTFFFGNVNVARKVFDFAALNYQKISSA